MFFCLYGICIIWLVIQRTQVVVFQSNLNIKKILSALYEIMHAKVNYVYNQILHRIYLKVILQNKLKQNILFMIKSF